MPKRWNEYYEWKPYGRVDEEWGDLPVFVATSGGGYSDKSMDLVMIYLNGRIFFFYHQDEGTVLLATITMDELVQVLFTEKKRFFWVKTICSQANVTGANIYGFDDYKNLLECECSQYESELVKQQNRMGYNPKQGKIIFNFKDMKLWKCYLPSQEAIMRKSWICKYYYAELLSPCLQKFLPNFPTVLSNLVIEYLGDCESSEYEEE